MSTILYVALATADTSGGYRATFPDLSDCTVSAPDLAQLLLTARQTVSTHLQRLADAGDTWPQPTPIEKISLTPGLFPVLVDVAVEDTPVRVNISLGERLLQRLDAAAEAKGMTRSGFIAQAVRVSLGERGPAPEFEAATRRLQEELRTVARKINDSLGPNSAFSRRMTELDEQIHEGVRNAADNVAAAMARRREANRAAAASASTQPPPSASAPPRPDA